jgi:hypothetical protein
MSACLSHIACGWQWSMLLILQPDRVLANHNYGANVAIALGRRHFDGDGNLTGTILVNEPTPGSTTGERTIVTATQMGTYTVNCDGTGVFTRILTVNGVKTTQTDNFVITKAVVKHHHLLATAIVDAQTTPSAIIPGGIFLTRTFTRLPDTGDEDDNDNERN